MSFSADRSAITATAELLVTTVDEQEQLRHAGHSGTGDTASGSYILYRL